MLVPSGGPEHLRKRPLCLIVGRVYDSDPLRWLLQRGLLLLSPHRKSRRKSSLNEGSHAVSVSRPMEDRTDLHLARQFPSLVGPLRSSNQNRRSFLHLACLIIIPHF